jgi:RNase P subunit RPR2
LMSNRLDHEEKQIEYKRYSRFYSINEMIKPTCKKHHEYVKVDEGITDRRRNIIYSKWECRFCGKKL